MCAAVASDPPAAKPVASREAAEVLRYWSAVLRYEEALSAHPRARRPAQGQEGALNLAQPVAGQDYMKLPFAGAERFLLEQRGPCKQALDAERRAFFEHWLAARYRHVDDESRLAHFVSFPVLHSPREELFGLLRFAVEPQWWCGERRFEVPSVAERRAPLQREAPDQIELRALEPELKGAPPYFVDLKLLRETLRAPSEALDELCALLRREPAPSGAQLIDGLCQLLAKSIAEEQQGEPASKGELPAEPLARLHALLSARLRQLGSRTRAFPVALVVASERSRTTWHVQRDLEQAAEQLEEDELDSDAPLGAYLSGSAPPGAGQVCLGRWPAAPLTGSQRQALEHALGSRLAAVQGPPGTGKTTVILNLVAHQLIEKVRAFVSSGVMSEDFVLVTSTNNRAVDNVVEALSIEPFIELPLCLRLGHRALTEKVSARVLQRAHAWLSQQPERVAPEELEAAKQAFSQALAQVDAQLGPAREAYQREAQLAQWQAARGELTRQGSAAARQEAEQLVAARVAALLQHGASQSAGTAAAQAAERSAANGSAVDRSAMQATAAEPWRAAPKAAELACASALRAFDKLAELCDARGTGVLKRLRGGFERLQAREWVALERALGVSLPRVQAPGAGAPDSTAAKTDAKDPAAQPVTLEDWEDFVADAVTPLNALAQALAQLVASERAAEQLRALEQSLAAPASAADPGLAPSEESFALLFQRALELRGVWLRQHRAALLSALEQAISQCKNLRSLRQLLGSTKAGGSWLRQLFPSIGCTLLSLGNALDSAQPSCRRVVVDEAGQCPSAYAVSALLRARNALLIGDVHQLEPVIGLSREDEQRIVRSLKLSQPAQRLAPYRMFDESGNSAQSLADRAVRERPTLRDHFRCQPAIIALAEAWCGYGMTVRTPPRTRAEQAPRLAAAALFQDCAGEQQRYAGSWVNPSEIDQVVAWLAYLLQQGIPAADIGVITPFRSQSEALIRRFGQERLPLARALDEEEGSDNLELFGARGARGAGIAVGTVHRFQGGERSIILFSSTLTRAANLRFVDERVNLLNVAVSRAREHLLVIGHGETLRAGRNTRLLVSQAQPVAGF